MPSRIDVTLPADLANQIETARNAYRRFGEFAKTLQRIRSRIEREPVEREQLRALCWEHGLPGDFDIAQILWKPDYDQFYYHQLYQRARRLFLFREEYIFDLQTVIVVEKPKRGHATYLFSKPQDVKAFLALYVARSKEDIRENHGDLVNRLGFLGRVIHGSDPRIWLRHLTAHLGEPADPTPIAPEQG